MKRANFVTLEADINIAREKMINYASEYGYLDQGTIKLSRQLDQLINQYTRLKYKRT
ncbi:Spo0E family sporulation regulatory protein-aspartic acid phosphatase [Pradoshia sp.]